MTKLYEALSVFPEVFESYLSASIMGRAREAGIFDFRAHDLRDWTHDRHRTVDDAPFGGGQGMLMKPAPIFEAMDDVSSEGPRPHVVFFSPCGTPFTQAVAERLAGEERVLFVCGRYEGIDERAYGLADETISLGDYVLTGGELAALVVIDAVVRLLPGALGDEMSARDESFSSGLLEYAQYTRPASYRGMDVPPVLLSGDHARVDAWRRMSAVERTARWRPDLLAGAELSAREREAAERIQRELADPASTASDILDDQGEWLFVRTISNLLHYAVVVCAALAVALLLRTFAVEPFVVPSGSMLPTIQVGDLLVGEKVSYRTREPERGEVVTFYSPVEQGTILIKRVIASGGQTVDMRDGYVYVDGERLDEPYVNGEPSYPLDENVVEGGIQYPYTVPEGSIWVMGDNRTSSADSRYFGAVPVSCVTSRAVFIFWPFSDASML